MHPLAVAVRVIPPYRLYVAFADGTSGEVDCRQWLYEGDTGVFAELRDPAAFARVWVNHESGVIEWFNGADVAPETLYEEAHRTLAR